MPTPQIATLATIAASFFAAVLVPGPSSVTVMRTSLSGGARSGLASAIGVASGNSLYAAGAAFGLVAIIETSGVAFVLLKVVGGLYLVHLGLRMLFNRSQPVQQLGAVKEAACGPAFRRGLATDLSNPKTVMAFLGIFAVAFPAHPSLSLSILSVAVIGAISLTWHCMLAGLFARPAFRQAYQRIGRWIDRVAGTIISSFGIALAVTGL